jgi:hypothetical protein
LSDIERRTIDFERGFREGCMKGAEIGLATAREAIALAKAPPMLVMTDEQKMGYEERLTKARDINDQLAAALLVIAEGQHPELDSYDYAITAGRMRAIAKNALGKASAQSHSFKSSWLSSEAKCEVCGATWEMGNHG